MSAILTYRPYLAYRRKLDVFLRRHDESGYAPSAVVRESLALPSVGVLLETQAAIEGLNTFIGKTENSLQGRIANGPTINEYIEAREQNSLAIIYEFEDYHESSLEEISTAAEILPFLYLLRDELVAIYTFANDYLLDGELKYDNAELLREKEEAELNTLIELDGRQSAPLDLLSEENHVKQFCQGKAGFAFTAIEDLDNTLGRKTGSRYYGAIQDIVHFTATDERLRDSLERTGTESKQLKKRVEVPKDYEQIEATHVSRFRKYQERTSDAKHRTVRLMNQDKTLSLLEKLSEMQEKKIHNKHVIRWIERHEPQSPTDPIHIYIEDLIEGVEETNDYCEQLTNDLYSVLELSYNQVDDYLDSLQEKKDIRSLYHSLAMIKENYNPGSADPLKETERFLRHYDVGGGEQETMQLHGDDFHTGDFYEET